MPNDRVTYLLEQLGKAMNCKNEDKMYALYPRFTQAVKHHGTGWGADVTVLTPEELQQLINGETLVVDDGEYVHYVCAQNVTE